MQVNGMRFHEHNTGIFTGPSKTAIWMCWEQSPGGVGAWDAPVSILQQDIQ